MADIKLFSVKDGQEISSSAVKLEGELHLLIEKYMQAFFGVTFLAHEYAITEGRMDSIGLDENNCPVIFEYKKQRDENVINQGLFYLDWLLDHKADFQLLVQKKLGKEKSENIDWNFPCVICIAHTFTKYDEHAVKQMNRNIKLIKYKIYDNDLIAFEQVNENIKQSAMQAVEQHKTRGKIEETFTDKYNRSSEKMKKLYDAIKEYILSLGDDIVENQLVCYSAFRKIKNVVCVDFYQSKLLLFLRLNPDEVELQEGFIEDYRGIGHWGTGDLRLTIKDDNDFERAKYLIDKAYSEN